MRLAIGALALGLLAAPVAAQEEDTCGYELAVLGAGQDAGAPQIGNADDEGPRLLPSSLALIDRAHGRRYLFDASPAITEQLAMLDGIAPPGEGRGLGVDGVFLTHAHIGHYLGLAYFGREAAGAGAIRTYAMPRMIEFLAANGPWSQLVELENITLDALTNGRAHDLGGGLSVTPIIVPHRDEYSETVGFVIAQAEAGRALYLPDIDYWPTSDGESLLMQVLPTVDRVFIDATFWDDNELLDENGVGRDMSEIPHPRVADTMDMVQHLPPAERGKVHFIHYNHTNPIRDPSSPESHEVTDRGFHVARRGARYCL